MEHVEDISPHTIFPRIETTPWIVVFLLLVTTQCTLYLQIVTTPSFSNCTHSITETGWRWMCVPVSIGKLCLFFYRLCCASNAQYFHSYANQKYLLCSTTWHLNMLNRYFKKASVESADIEEVSSAESAENSTIEESPIASIYISFRCAKASSKIWPITKEKSWQA